MCLATVHGRALDDPAAAPVTLEVHLANGFPNFTAVGLADTEAKEARERARRGAARRNSGPHPLDQQQTVNPAPTDTPEEAGTSLSMALCPSGARYQGRLGAPLDQLDLLIEAPAIPPCELQDLPTGEPSAVVAARVASAREPCPGPARGARGARGARRHAAGPRSCHACGTGARHQGAAKALG
ncbi:MAG: hypothetical protein HY020_10120 [Burkholderiales bacterium]|nr:hypothetical protein [Burkholderiales bacterium]